MLRQMGWRGSCGLVVTVAWHIEEPSGVFGRHWSWQKNGRGTCCAIIYSEGLPEEMSCGDGRAEKNRQAQKMVLAQP